MPRKSRPRLLAASVDRFEADLHRFANELVRSVFEAEFARVTVSATVAQRKRGRRASVSKSPAPPSPSPAESARTSAQWTRDSVISELSRWLIASKDLDMSFLKRHGPNGLVGAAKRFFGRFDAALNAANLAIARQMEGKPDAAGARDSWPSMRELARRQRERRAASPTTT